MTSISLWIVIKINANVSSSNYKSPISSIVDLDFLKYLAKEKCYIIRHSFPMHCDYQVEALLIPDCKLQQGSIRTSCDSGLKRNGQNHEQGRNQVIFSGGRAKWCCYTYVFAYFGGGAIARLPPLCLRVWPWASEGYFPEWHQVQKPKGVKISFYALEIKKRACLANDKIAISHFKIQEIPWLPYPLHTTVFMINSISCLHFWTFYKFKELFIYKEYWTIEKPFIL